MKSSFCIFKRYLGISLKKKFSSILLDLVCVSAGIKATLLFDYACIPAEKLYRMCSDLFESGHICKPLDVLLIEQDLFVCCATLLIQDLRQKLTLKSVTFIDVSGQLRNPCIIEKDSDRFNTIMARMCSSFVKKLEQAVISNPGVPANSKTMKDKGRLEDKDRHGRLLRIENGENSIALCSVFGFFLGYPVIYWQDDRTEYNCLEMCPLHIFRMKLNISDRLIQSNETFSSCVQELLNELRNRGKWNHVLYSFSSPVALEHYCIERVRAWCREFMDRTNTELKEFLQFSCDLVDGQQVVL